MQRLGSKIRLMAAEMAATTCEWLHLLERFDKVEGWAGHGLLSCAHWLSWTCSVSPGTARGYLRVARALPTLPLVDAAFAAGRLSYSKVRAIVRVADRVDEAVLLEQALVQTVSQLERTIGQYRRLDGDGLAQQRRRRASWQWDDDGMLVLSARLPPDEGALLVAALEQMRTENMPPPTAASSNGKDRSPRVCPPPDIDPYAFAAADAIVALAEKALAAGDVDSSGDDRHLLILHADLDVLSDFGQSAKKAMIRESPGVQTSTGRHSWRRTAALQHGQPGQPGQRCHLENGPGLDRQTAQRIACDAAYVAVLHHVGKGEPLRLGRKTRAISPAQRRALRIRDGGCQFPGCHRRRFLEAHHVRHWSQLGRTDLDNLVLVCRFHHMLVHEGGYQVAADRDVGWVFRTPLGVAIPRTPEPPVTDGPAGIDDPAVTHGARNIDDLLPGWAGEPFHLWATVAVLLDNPRRTMGEAAGVTRGRAPADAA